MKSTTNVFLDGLIMDMHPLTTLNKNLTNALNATQITFNGNELVLQNDMGNTLIEDSVTGNVMGLSNGFVPLGMKEHGGVLYIASYNPSTGEGEIGSIPSPVISYTYKDKETNSDTKQLTDVNNTYDNDIKLHVTKDLYQISDHLFRVGDLFIVILYFAEGELKTDNNEKLTTRFNGVSYPIFTKVNGLKGWYKIKLYSKALNGQIIDVTNAVENDILKYYLKNNSQLLNSDYWFIATEDTNIELDIDKCRALNAYHTYPNIPNGFLYIGIEPELPSDIKMLKNETTGVNGPFLYINPEL